MLKRQGPGREGQAEVRGVVSRTRFPIQTAAGNPASPAIRQRLAALWAAWLAAERDRMPLWLPVALAGGIALWFWLPLAPWRLAAAALLLGLVLGGGLAGWRPVALAAAFALAGMAASQWRTQAVAHPVLAERHFATLVGRVAAAEPRPWGAQRLVLDLDPRALPGDVARVRIMLRPGMEPVAAGALVRVRALLSPPAGAAVPGGFDLARRAWFDGIGATGMALGPPMVLTAPPPGPALWLADARAALQQRITARLPGETGALVAAFVTGWQGAIPPATAQAMRDAGLAHLLSISGLHIAVVVGGMALIARLLLGLWPWLALRVPVPTLALAIGAASGLAYTLLAGAQVPTVRAVIAAVIVVIGMMLGRQALSLRLLAAAATAILLVRPEALLGASFQMSFAAVIGIVALHESRLGRWLARDDDGAPWWAWAGRRTAALLASGLVAEFALSGIGLYHFGRSGLYGIIANLVAIPFSSFVVMPALMLGLLGEAVGSGVLWPLAGRAMAGLVFIADLAASLPGAVVTSAAIPAPAFALGALGGLWLALWRTRVRWLGLGPILGAVWLAWATPLPDLLVSSDGRHVAVRLPDGRLAFSRARVGDYLASNWAEAVGSEPQSRLWLGQLPGARCSADACVADVARGGRRWRLLATTSRDFIARPDFEPACAAADIIVADRRLPDWCRPRWLKLDAAALAATGAVAVRLDRRQLITAAAAIGDRPWQPGNGRMPGGRRGGTMGGETGERP